MKNLVLAIISLGVLVTLGCASSQTGLVLAPVGPEVAKSAETSSNGTLIVYSAFEVTPPSTSDFDDTKHYSDYRIQTNDGSPVQVVHNRSNGLGDEPRSVELAAGTFRVVAKANGHGLVTVPVVIVANKSTTVHLEGGAPRASALKSTSGDLVTLPDGQVVGWKAPTVASSR